MVGENELRMWKTPSGHLIHDPFASTTKCRASLGFGCRATNSPWGEIVERCGLWRWSVWVQQGVSAAFSLASAVILLRKGYEGQVGAPLQVLQWPNFVPSLSAHWQYELPTNIPAPGQRARRPRHVESRLAHGRQLKVADSENTH